MEIGNLINGNSRGNYSVNRDWQTEFSEFLEVCGFDSYGYIKEESLESNRRVEERGDTRDIYFENDAFIVRPYYWGEDKEIASRPNFVFKPTGFEMNWYKYPLRDSYMNQEITISVLLEITKACQNSLSK